MMGSLGGCVFWEKSNSSSTNWIPHILNSLPEGGDSLWPVLAEKFIMGPYVHFYCMLHTGSCPSVSFEPSTRHFFSSFRPTKRSPRGKHVVSRPLNYIATFTVCSSKRRADDFHVDLFISSCFDYTMCQQTNHCRANPSSSSLEAPPTVFFLALSSSFVLEVRINC